MPTFEIYTTGGGYYLYDVFNFLAAYTGSGNYNNLLYIGVIIDKAKNATTRPITINKIGSMAVDKDLVVLSTSTS